MNRLTQKDDQGNWSLKGVAWESLYEGQVVTKELRERLYGALWKLMEYEDTGLTPEEIMELRMNEKCQWTPVCYGFPYRGQSVLVTTMADPDPEIVVLSKDGTWHSDAGYTMRFDEVIAWMPLPEPYKEKIELKEGKEMTEKQRNMLEGMDLLLRRFNKCEDGTLFEVREIIKASNEVYKEILEEN